MKITISAQCVNGACTIAYVNDNVFISPVRIYASAVCADAFLWLYQRITKIRLLLTQYLQRLLETASFGWVV